MRSYTLSKQYREFSARISEKQGGLRRVPSGTLARTCRNIKNAAGFAGFLEISDMAQVLEYGFANAAKTAKKDERAFRVLLIKAYRLLLKTIPKPPGKIPKAFQELFARLKTKLPDGWRIQRDVERLLVTNESCRIPRRFYEEAMDRDLHLVLVAFDPERARRDIESLTGLAERLVESGVLLRHGPLLPDNISEPENHYFLIACKDNPEDLVARERIPGSILRTVYSPGEPEPEAGARQDFLEESFLTESFRAEEEEIELPGEPPEAGPTTNEELYALTEGPDSRKKKTGDGTSSPERRSGPSEGRFSVFILSMIFLLSLAGAAALAARLFLEKSEAGVEANNQTTSRLLGLKLESDFRSSAEKAGRFVSLVSTETGTETGRMGIAGLFFSENPDVLYAGLPGKADFFNEKALAALGLQKGDFGAAMAAQTENLASLKAGETVAVNLTPLLKRPVLGLGLPYRGGGGQEVLAVAVSLEGELKTLKDAGIDRTFAVNGGGELILHSDVDRLSGKIDYRELPVVAMMMKSRTEEGGTRYRDPEGRTHAGSYRRVSFANIGVVTTTPVPNILESFMSVEPRELYALLAGCFLAAAAVYFLSIYVLRRAARRRD